MFLKKIYVKLVPRCYREAFYEKRAFPKLSKKIIDTNKIYETLSKKTKNEKINLVFIVYMPETWSTLKSIFEAAKQDSRFNCFLLAQPDMEDLNNNKAYAYLSTLYPETIKTYTDNKWVELESLKPDYIFYNRPYNYQYYTNYQSQNAKKIAKLCLVEYGFLLTFSHIFYICTQPEFIKDIAFFFCSTKSLKKKMDSRFNVKGYKYPQFIHTGYSAFDNLDKTLPISSTKETILWTPRWTIASTDKYNSPSHFLDYIDNFMEYAKKHPEMDFILRPHPLMFDNFIKNNVYTKEDVSNLYKRCDELKNISIDTNASFMPSIQKATLIITDLTSLLVNYLYHKKPIIYCDKPFYFTKEAKEMYSTFYHSLNWKSIEKNIELIRTGDPLKEKRLINSEKLFTNNKKNVYEQILNFLVEDTINE